MPRARVVRLNECTIGVPEIRAVAEVLRSAMVTQGKRVRMFEEAMLQYLGLAAPSAPKRAALMVNSGSSANLLAVDHLRAHANGRERVITPALTWSTTVAPIIQHRLRPVFVDVLPDLTMDPELAAVAMEDSGDAAGPPLAVMPVHLTGHPCNMERIGSAAEQNCVRFVVEDACEALGAAWNGHAVGTWGDLATFSFYLSHHLSTVEGGLVVVAKEHEAAMRSAREHGWIRDYSTEDKERFRTEYPDLDPRWTFDRAGYNVRSTEINAALGLIQLGHQRRWQAQRITNARWYAENLTWPSLVHPYRAVPREASPNPFYYPLVVAQDAPYPRAELVEWLEARGVETRPIMSGNITRHPWLRRAGLGPVELPVTDWVHTHGFLLPCHPSLMKSDLRHVQDCIASFMRSKGLREGGETK